MNNKKIIEIAMNQSGVDYNYDPKLLEKEGVHIVPRSYIKEGARNYLKESPFLNIDYYGKGIVCICHESISGFVDNYFNRFKDSPYRVFDAPQINVLSEELKKHNMCIAHIADYYLPDVNFSPKLNNEIEVKMLIGDEIESLYYDKRFSMALHYKRETKRRDELAIVAYVKDEIAGVAACTNDSETMWQIGVDVLEKFRYKGIASTLTYLLSQEILKLGKVPFYCTAYSNLASRNTARKAGFKSAWISLTAKSAEEEWIQNIYRTKES